MKELERYVKQLFRQQADTAEMRDLKEEILSNMQAQKADLMAQGLSEDEAIRQVKNSLPSLDGLVEDQQLTWVDRYHTDCLRAMLLTSIVYWILILPTQVLSWAQSNWFFQAKWYLLFGMVITLILAVAYWIQKSLHQDRAERRAISECRRKVALVWKFWGALVAVILLTEIGVYWASDIWFHRPLHLPHINGPWSLAVTLLPFYLLALTALVPLTAAQFPKMLQKQRKEPDDEA